MWKRKDSIRMTTVDSISRVNKPVSAVDIRPVERVELLGGRARVPVVISSRNLRLNSSCVIITMKLDEVEKTGNERDRERKRERKREDMKKKKLLALSSSSSLSFLYSSKKMAHTYTQREFFSLWKKVRHMHCSSWIVKHGCMIHPERRETFVVPIGVLER